MREFRAGYAYSWDDLLTKLREFGYPRRKRGSLAVDADPSLPVFVFLSERNSGDYENGYGFTNGHSNGQVVMQVNPAELDRNARLRASDTGLEIGIFFRANLTKNQQTFTFLGRGRFVPAASDGTFYTFRCPSG